VADKVTASQSDLRGTSEKGMADPQNTHSQFRTRTRRAQYHVPCELAVIRHYRPPMLNFVVLFVGGCRWIQIPSILYGSHVATTVFAIIYHILVADFTQNNESNQLLVHHGVTGPETLSERLLLSSIYTPYLIVPLLLVYTMLTSPDYQPFKSKSY